MNTKLTTELTSVLIIGSITILPSQYVKIAREIFFIFYKNLKRRVNEFLSSHCPTIKYLKHCPTIGKHTVYFSGDENEFWCVIKMFQHKKEATSIQFKLCPTSCSQCSHHVIIKPLIGKVTEYCFRDFVKIGTANRIFSDYCYYTAGIMEMQLKILAEFVLKSKITLFLARYIAHSLFTLKYSVDSVGMNIIELLDKYIFSNN